MRKAWAIVTHAVRDFIADDAMSLGGALAFFTALSLAPLLVLVLSVAGFLGQEVQIRVEIVRRAYQIVGPSGAEVVQTIMREAGRNDAQGPAAVLGLLTLLFSATTAFAQLQLSLNRVWNVEPRPGRSARDFLRKRLLSLAMILAISVLLIGSLVASATLRFVLGSTDVELPGGARTWGALSLAVSLAVYTGIFTVLHHALPDVRMRWKDSLVGGAVTAALFAAGKEVLGWYLVSAGVTSAYGAAGSLFFVLVWVYYSSLILFVGAELTQAFAEEMGHPVEPERHARYTAEYIARA